MDRAPHRLLHAFVLLTLFAMSCAGAETAAPDRAEPPPTSSPEPSSSDDQSDASAPLAAPTAPAPTAPAPVGPSAQTVVLQEANPRVTGVVYRDRHGALVTVRTRQEVLLCAGAVGSPHILLLSGIGPKYHLESMGIAVKTDLPGVGQNLHDHPDFVLQFKCLQPISLWPKTRPLAMIAAGMRWLVAGDGLCASNHFDAVACIRSDAGVEYPDLQLTMSPIAVDENWSTLEEHAFQIHVGLMRAHSRGSIELRTDNPADAPRILVNYLQDPRDRELMRKGIHWVRELVEQPAFSALKGTEIFPGAECQSDAELDAKLKSHTSSQWHLSCTARMGPATDRLAVVDSKAKVHGLSGLRVVDASIMPFVTNGNTNAPTIMLAEKLSDAILGLAPLAPMDLPVWKSPNHKHAQR